MSDQGNESENKPIVVHNGILYSSTPSFDLILTEPASETLLDVPVFNNVDKPIQFKLDILIIDSIKSGVGRDPNTDVFAKLIKPLFKNLGILKFEYIQTKDESSVTDVATQLNDSRDSSSNNGVEKDLFVIFISGDTSISEFINGINDVATTNDLYIANIAAGTGNALLSTLKISNVIESVSYLFSSSTVPLPIHEISFENCVANLTIQDKLIKQVTRLSFIAVFSWLFHAALVADSDTPELRKLGISRFAIAARQNLESVQDFSGEVINDGVKLSSNNHSYLTYTTLSNFEKNFKISPNANLEDLYLIEIGNDVQHESLMEIMTQAYKDGAHVHNDKVNYLKISNGSILKIPINLPDSKLRFCLDGSIIKLQRKDTTKDIEINIHKRQIKGWNIKLLIKK